MSGCPRNFKLYIRLCLAFTSDPNNFIFFQIHPSGSSGKLNRSLVVETLTIHAPNVVGRKLGHFKITLLSVGLLKTITFPHTVTF